MKWNRKKTIMFHSISSTGPDDRFKLFYQVWNLLGTSEEH